MTYVPCLPDRLTARQVMAIAGDDAPSPSRFNSALGYGHVPYHDEWMRRGNVVVRLYRSDAVVAYRAYLDKRKQVVERVKKEKAQGKRKRSAFVTKDRDWFVQRSHMYGSLLHRMYESVGEWVEVGVLTQGRRKALLVRVNEFFAHHLYKVVLPQSRVDADGTVRVRLVPRGQRSELGMTPERLAAVLEFERREIAKIRAEQAGPHAWARTRPVIEPKYGWQLV